MWSTMIFLQALVVAASSAAIFLQASAAVSFSATIFPQALVDVASSATTFLKALAAATSSAVVLLPTLVASQLQCLQRWCYSQHWKLQDDVLSNNCHHHQKQQCSNHDFDDGLSLLLVLSTLHHLNSANISSSNILSDASLLSNQDSIS
ncbi:hypothetical protein COLO4_38167 [Corchorus olitorius]|uniref:Uncharacterized protein n=1 Tax=Corchorus olitorius TaxID=93759 RepID=A0A1R3FWK1_9ROSI|nr:hypothetical protein COLO4_38167 [Corchorus olitorius]